MSEEKQKDTGFMPKYGYPILAVCGGLGYVIYTSKVNFTGEVTQFSKFLYALRWQVLSGFTLIYSVMRVGHARNKNKVFDPLSQEGQHLIEPYSRRLQNTLEQLSLNVVGQLILSTYLEPENIRIIPGLVLLFVAGRVLFFVGYPNYRAAGFMLTFFPTIGTYLANLYFLATSGPLFRL